MGVERIEDTEPVEVVFDNYPTNKYAKKVDWWISKEGLDLIKGWRQCGCTIKQIAQRMDVDLRTFRTWRKQHPQLESILTVGQEVTNARVMDALYKRAVGYDYTESLEELVEGQMVITKIYHKHCPPDIKAALSWLYNRFPDAWRAIQAPLDVDASALLDASKVLVQIQQAAEENTETTEDAGNGEGSSNTVASVQ